MFRSLVALTSYCLLWMMGCTPAREFGLRYTEVIDLQGSWLFRLDDAGVGIAERWFEQVLPDTVSLPGSTDENRVGLLNDGSLEQVTEDGNHILSPTISWLTRRYSYVGPAWYQREIVIPENWHGKRIALFLERCHWDSQVWIDSLECGMQNSLSTPHTYELPRDLMPGAHRLTIRVDNTIRLNVGNNAHSITQHTQTNWNGIIGRMELQVTDPVWIDEMRVYPNTKTRAITIVLNIGNLTEQPARGSVRLVIRDSKGLDLQERIEPVTSIAPGESQISFEWQQDATTALWDENTPELFDLCAELKVKTESRQYIHERATRFGMRSFTHNGSQFLLNGRVTHLRGTLECCIFPLTGYPTMDVDAWLRNFRTAQSYGLNHIRFHSWCPPEAAFVAADQLGMILQIEAPVWTFDLGRASERDHWLEQEIADILDTYGNHPSFCLFSLGNELGGDLDFMQGLVNRAKERDPRHLYTTTSAGGIPHRAGNPQPCDDYLVAFTRQGSGMRGRPWMNCRFTANPPETAVDYRQGLAGLTVPFVSHEIGQWTIYPDFREIDKYTGVLRPRNFEVFRDSLAAHHMLDQANDFVRASGELSALLYKEEIETNLRTPGIGGFQLLDLHDFPGQGTALVGILNAFWESKGIVSAEEHRRYCGDIVPLARLSKRTWTNDETLSAGMEIAHYGANDLQDVMPLWSLTDESGVTVARGEFPRQTIRRGGVTELGMAQAPLQPVTQARRLKLRLEIPETAYRNDWDLWVYPADRAVVRPASVIIAGALNSEVQRRLKDGQSILLTPKLESLRQALPGRFTTIFWSPIWFPEQGAVLTMGLLCKPEHPALAQFPTDFHTNWQWWDLVTRSKALVLEPAPPQFRPIVQVIDDYSRNQRLGSLFEARVGAGRLMVSAFDLTSDLDNRPAARQLLRSILEYMASDNFQPTHELTWEALQQIVQ